MASRGRVEQHSEGEDHAYRMEVEGRYQVAAEARGQLRQTQLGAGVCLVSCVVAYVFAEGQSVTAVGAAAQVLMWITRGLALGRGRAAARPKLLGAAAAVTLLLAVALAYAVLQLQLDTQTRIVGVSCAVLGIHTAFFAGRLAWAQRAPKLKL